jgi:GNAT superfamily N-acetyltransferase
VDPDQILLFKLLRILPEARGRGLGLAVINRIMEKFGRGCDFAAMMCHPLQLNQKNKESSAFNRRLALDALETDEKKANRSLARYYRKAGFEPVKGTDGLMVKNIGM